MAICIPTFTGYINHQNHFALKLRELHLQKNLLKKSCFQSGFHTTLATYETLI